MRWAVFLLLLSPAARAEPETQTVTARPPISTDSPTISRSSHTVGEGVGVIELNYGFSSTRDGNPSAHQLPLVLRGGVSEQFELRLETNSYIWQGPTRGLGDLSLGFKYEFEADWAVIGLVQLPTGSPALRSNTAIPFVSLAHDHALSDEDGLLFNAGASFLPNGITQVLGTMVYSRMIREDIAWFFESALVGSDVRIDTGLQFWPNSEWVINLAVLRGLSGNGQDWGATLGIGSRF